MTVYRISKCQYIDDLSGTGAATYSGRWHSKGTYILYTAATASLALLESVVHISKIPIMDYCMITLEVPEEAVISLSMQELPANWQQNPSPASLQSIGNNFIAENNGLVLKIPSAIMPEDFNYLINPNHKDFKKLKVVARRKLFIDNRLLKNY